MLLALFLAACNSSGEQTTRQLPTDAQVEQYNALVEPEERIVCRNEVPVGSNIPRRICRRIQDMEETSRFHREQLRQVLR